MNEIVKMELWQFSLVYLLLFVVLAIMKKCNINQTKLLFIASIKMTIQLIIAGLLLTYIFKNPKPYFTFSYVFIMLCFAIHRVLIKNRDLNIKFKIIISASLAFSGLAIMTFFVCIVVGESIINPQYVIPISGMILGNAMTGMTISIKTFKESLESDTTKIETLLNLGANPKKILLPFVNRSLETSMLPTLNSMLGMGIVSLPGMMTGQILSGTLPTTAILYQIAILVSICTVVSISSFAALWIGSMTLYKNKNTILFK